MPLSNSLAKTNPSSVAKPETTVLCIEGRKMRIQSSKLSMPRTTLRLVSILAAILFSASLNTAMAEGKEQGYEQKKREINDIAVSIIVSGIQCTCARFAEDIRNVVNDLRPDGLRVLPVVGVGGLQNLKDVLFLRSLEMAVVDQDNMILLKRQDPKLYADIERRVQYITKLYNAEIHVLARDDIKSYQDLSGKKVNFNIKDSQTEVTAERLFGMLNVPVEKSYYDNDESIRRLRAGELSAMIVVTGAPQVALAKLKKEDGVHFLPFDQDRMPGVDLETVLSEYLPAELTSTSYPNLIPEGTAVPTLANRALLITYAWSEHSDRYRKVAKFVNEFFGKINEFHTSSRHPKWSEINLAADIPGWTRFKPAADWLAVHQNQEQSSTIQNAVDKLLAQYSSNSGRDLSQSDKEALLHKMKQLLDSKETAR